MHFLMFYDLAPDYLERRPQYRTEHLALAWDAVERGELVLGGALAEPADGGILLFRTDSEAVPAAFAAADPYVKNGLVTGWRIRKWNTVVGNEATTPVRPD